MVDISNNMKAALLIAGLLIFLAVFVYVGMLFVINVPHGI